ncbi:MAG: response regulator [Eubacterium sp.]|nr:response regulator [Eubacterium sp.]
MDKYTLLLVDDEEDIIHAIRRKIDWESLGFTIVGYACNGVKALELVEEYQPDVVMTDIKMPYMNGMQLAHRIKTEYSATKILIFTGFDEFEYAREAVHLEVEEYILKPVNSMELAKVFEQLKIKLDQEISEKRNVEVLQNYYMESLPFLQTNFYSMLIEGRVREEEIPRYLSDCRLSFSGPLFCCLVVHTSSSQVPEGMTHLLLSTSVQKQAEEHLGEKWQAKAFPSLENTVLIAQLKCEAEITELTDDCDRFCKYALHIIGAVVTIGIGQVCDKLYDLSESYISARTAVSYRVIYGASQAINMKENIPQEVSKKGNSDDSKIYNLFKMIRLGSEEDVVKAVDGYLHQASFQGRTLQQYHVDIMELISAFYRFAANHEINPEAFPGDMKILYARLLDMGAEALQKWLTDLSISFRGELLDARNQSTRSFVSRAQEYVHNNYTDESLSLDRVCQELGVSNSYFSTVFKKKTGKSFVAYLTDYRMDQASRLMIETNDKSYIIARQVGYTDPNYFSYVFKRRFGVSPSRYRSEHAESGCSSEK